RAPDRARDARGRARDRALRVVRYRRARRTRSRGFAPRATRASLDFRAVDPVTVSPVLSPPREQVFDYLADIANHSEFTDHYLVDWHLTRIDSVGLGAGA